MRILSSLLLVVGLASSPALAQDPAPATPSAQEVADVIAKVEAKYAKVETIQANFSQTKKDAFGKTEQDGDVALKRPTKMRWRFTTGEQSQFVTDGDTLWIYTKADNQVLRIADTSKATSTANTFLTSLDSLDEVFKVTLVENEDGPTLDLVPREEGMYKSIQLGLDAELKLASAVFTDQYGNVTDIRFRDVKLDGDLPDSTFVFTPPEGATVIDN